MALTVGAVLGAFFLPRPRPAKVSLVTWLDSTFLASDHWVSSWAMPWCGCCCDAHQRYSAPSHLEHTFFCSQLNGKVNGLGDHKAVALLQPSIQGPELLDFLKKRRSVYPKDFSGEPVSRYKVALEPRTVCVMHTSAGRCCPCPACPCQCYISRRAGNRHADNCIYVFMLL